MKLRKSFRFLDNCMLICCLKLSLLSTEYLSSTVNVLTKSRNILDITKRDFFKLNIVIEDQQL